MKLASGYRDVDAQMTEWLREELGIEFIRAIEVDEEVIYVAERCEAGIGARIVFPSMFKDYSEEAGVYATDCPREILELLTPTVSETAALWRASCWTRVRRAAAWDAEEGPRPPPWVACWAGERPASFGFRPYYVARIDEVKPLYAGTDGKRIAAGLLDHGEENCLHPLSAYSEYDNDDVELGARRSGLSLRYVLLGQAPYQVAILMTEQGAFVTWSALPSQFEHLEMMGDGYVPLTVVR